MNSKKWRKIACPQCNLTDTYSVAVVAIYLSQVSRCRGLSYTPNLIWFISGIDDSTHRKSIHEHSLMESTRLVSLDVHPSCWKLICVTLTKYDSVQIELSGEVSQTNWLSLLWHLTNEEGSWRIIISRVLTFGGVVDSMRIKSNRQVPQTNRLNLGVLDMDEGVKQCRI